LDEEAALMAAIYYWTYIQKEATKLIIKAML
jgi:hypothetical protein